MDINVKVRTDELVQAVRGINARATNVAIARSINKALLMGRTAMKREITKAYKIKSSALGTYDADGVLAVKRANSYKLFGTIEASSRTTAMSLFEPVFKTDQSTTYGKLRGAYGRRNKRSPKGQGMTVEILRGQVETIPSAFAILSGKFASGLAAVARGQYSGNGFTFGKEREPISFLKTKSILFAAFNNEVMKGYAPVIESIYFAELERNIAMMLDVDQ